MPRLQTLSLLAALLVLSALHPAYALAPAPLAPYHWYSLVLHHTTPSDVLKLMRWTNAAPEPNPFQSLPSTATNTPLNPNLPAGVKRIFTLPGNNSLLMEATDDGFTHVRQIIKILDIAPRAVEPSVTLSTISLSEKETTHLPFVRGDASDIELASGPVVSRAFDQLVQQGHTPLIASPVVKSAVFEPTEWVIPDYLISRSDFQADLSIRFAFRSLEGKRTSVESIVHRGEVLALRASANNSKTQITLVKVDF